MFIPTKSDSQIFVNLRNKLIEEKIKIKLSPHFRSSVVFPLPFGFSIFFFFFVFFLDVGPICPFIPLFGPFQPRNNLFCPGFNFLYLN